MYIFNFFDITNNGDVICKKSGNVINQYYCSGYKRVYLKGSEYFVHRLVSKKYIPNPKNKPQVNHINGIKDDNRVENLEWVTPLENHKHAVSIGLVQGSKLKNTSFTDINIENAFSFLKHEKAVLKNIYLIKYTSEKYKLSPYTVREIIKQINK